MNSRIIKSRLLVILVAANLRAALAAIPPIIILIARDLDLSIMQLSLLTAMPLVSYAIMPLFYNKIVQTFSMQHTIKMSLLLFSIFSLVRLIGSFETLYIGTLIMGVSIALLNVGLPIWISEIEKDAKAGLVGYYSAAMGFTSSVAIAVAVPLTMLIPGLSWRSALLPWSALALFSTIVVWRMDSLKRVPVKKALSKQPQRKEYLELLKDPRYRSIILFFAIQSVSTFSIGAWLPTILFEKGFSLASSGYLYAFASAVGALLGLTFSKQLVTSRSPQRIAIYASCLTMLGLFGTVSSSRLVLCATVLSISIGKFATYALAIHFMVSNTLSISGKQQLSSASQIIGYSLAFFGPIMLGATFEFSNSWNLGLVILGVLTFTQIYYGSQAAKIQI